MLKQTDLFGRLDLSIADLWAQATGGKLWRHVVSKGFDRELYRSLMVQIFHYTRHNSINQAVAALRALPEETELLRFAYGHAREELGHERMVLRDLKSIGFLAEEEVTEAPLPATDALINYLYGVALREGPVARLGYSYWAESAYRQINPLLLAARDSLALADENLTFFVAHAEIDSRHAEQVRSVLRRAVTTPERAEAVHRVAVTSLWLTIQILEQTFEASDLGREVAR
jgi:pyrroloquinoline quinone (PQQ) biosynthesis protein C